MSRDIAEVVVPGIIAVFIFLIVFGFFAFVRYLRYKETIALAERGLLREQHRRKSRNTLRSGVITTAVGLALTCGLMPIGFMTAGGAASRLPLGFFGPWMVIGLLPTFFGLGLIALHAINGDDEDVSVEMIDDDPIPPHKLQD